MSKLLKEEQKLIWKKIENGHYVCEEHNLRIVKDGFMCWYLIDHANDHHSIVYASLKDAKEEVQTKLHIANLLETNNALHNDNEGRHSTQSR